MITGAPGQGKSWALRILDARLSRMRDVVVRSIEHPQSGVSDFYRELGDLFGVALTPRNRWGGFKAIREKWQAHVDIGGTVYRVDVARYARRECPWCGRSPQRAFTSGVATSTRSGRSRRGSARRRWTSGRLVPDPRGERGS